jgi:hypothetical protein
VDTDPNYKGQSIDVPKIMQGDFINSLLAEPVLVQCSLFFNESLIRRAGTVRKTWNYDEIRSVGNLYADYLKVLGEEKKLKIYRPELIAQFTELRIFSREVLEFKPKGEDKESASAFGFEIKNVFSKKRILKQLTVSSAGVNVNQEIWQTMKDRVSEFLACI